MLPREVFLEGRSDWARPVLAADGVAVSGGVLGGGARRRCAASGNHRIPADLPGDDDMQPAQQGRGAGGAAAETPSGDAGRRLLLKVSAGPLVLSRDLGDGRGYGGLVGGFLPTA
jgi:hypothetical protein